MDSALSTTNNKDSLIFFALALASFMVGVDFLALAVAIDPLIKTFSITITTVQWILTAFAIGDASFLVSAGRLADIYDRKYVFAWGVFGFIFSSAVIACCTNIWLFIFMRFLQGISSGIMITTSIAIVNSYCPVAKRAGWISGLVGCTGLGMVTGPLLGGFLVQHISWRAIFVINVPVGILCLIIAHLAIPLLPPKTLGQKLDKIGVIIFTIALALLTISLSKAQDWGWLSITTIATLASAIICFGIFLVIEKRVAQPMMTFNLFSNRLFVFANYFGFVCYFLLSAWMIVFSFYLQTILQVSPSATGCYFAPFGIALLIVSLFVGKLSKKFNAKSLINAGLLFAILSLVGMILILKQNSILLLSICFAGFGVAYSLINSCSVPLALSDVDPTQVGIGSGISMMLRWLGSAIGAALITSIYTAFVSAHSHFYAIIHCLWIFIILSTISFIIGIVLTDKKS